MKIDEKILNRINELINLADEILNTAKLVTRSVGIRVVSPLQPKHLPKTIEERKVDSLKVVQWKTSCLHFLQKVFGESFHFKNFDTATQTQTYHAVRNGIGVLNAAKDDYENGFLFDTRTLIEAEIFSDIIEQSEELLKKGHYQAAAVVAGCVLEDGLRKLCDKNSITFLKKPTIEPMNVELAKIGIYNQFIKDKVSSLGKLRNHAAHGEWTEFMEKDVKDMIEGVRRFMEDYFS